LYRRDIWKIGDKTIQIILIYEARTLYCLSVFFLWARVKLVYCFQEWTLKSSFLFLPLFTCLAVSFTGNEFNRPSVKSKYSKLKGKAMGNCLSGGGGAGNDGYGSAKRQPQQYTKGRQNAGSRPPRHFSRIDSFPPSQLQSRESLGIISGSFNKELLFKIPEHCPVLSKDEDIDMVDLVEKGSRGVAVWRANLLIHGVVAAKVTIPNEFRDPADDDNEDSEDAQELFETELELLSSLEPHNNIIQFFGYQEKYVGKTLERRMFFEWSIDNVHSYVEHRTMEGKKTMQPIEVALISIQMAKGLEFLHNNKIAHRNISSDSVVLCLDVLDNARKDWLQNIAIDPMGITLPKQNEGKADSESRKRRETRKEGAYIRYLYTHPVTARLSNFSESKRLTDRDGQSCRANTLVGSVQFMCPEMFKKIDYDYSCDIWSFGAVIYEMITTKRPFEKRNNYAYIESRVTTGKFPEKERLTSKSLEYLENIMRQCLQVDHTVRGTAQELVAQLTNYSPNI